MPRRTKRLWTDEEKRSICFQTTASGVSVAQVALRYAVNANLIFKWRRDPRYAPDPVPVPGLPEGSRFLPVDIVAEATGLMMSNLFWLTDAQMEQLKPFFPKSHGKPRGDDRPVQSGIIFINRNGLRWCDAPRGCGPPRTLYDRWKRWGDMGVFARMMEGLAAEGTGQKTIRIDATYLKAHRTASSLRAKEGGGDDQRGRLIARTKGGLNSRLHAVTDAKGPLLKFFMTAGQVSDDTGAAALPGSPSAADRMLADRGHDADWFRKALKDKGIRPSIPARKSRAKTVCHDKGRHRRRNRIDIMFGRLKDWRRVATRDDRCARSFLSAVALAATVLFWL